MKLKLAFGAVFLVFISTLFYIRYEKQKQVKIKEEKIELIQSHFSEYVVASNEISLYDSSFNQVGRLGANHPIRVAISDDKENEYFQLADYPYFVYYNDVLPSTAQIDELFPAVYIPYNENIVTSNRTILYSKDNQVMLDIPESINVPIVVKEEQRYGIEYFGKTYYISKNDTIEIIQQLNSEEEVAVDIPVFMYHFFYDPAVGQAPDGNWLATTDFEDHLRYLSENGYHTIKMETLEKFLKGEIQLPKKTVVITIDDADPSVHDLAYPLIEKYEATATVFVITGWMGDFSYLKRDFIELHSHSHLMHQGGCSEQHGGRMLCIDEESGVNDLLESQTALEGSTVFCYPFGDVNEHAIELLKKAGYHLAFTTQPGRVYSGLDLYKLPRVRISSSTNINNFINLLKS